MIIEIEDYKGNTIGAVQICNMKVEKIIGNISIADIDGDDIWDTDDQKIRIQMEE